MAGDAMVVIGVATLGSTLPVLLLLLTPDFLKCNL